MPIFSVRVMHQLPPAEASRRVRTLLVRVSAEFAEELGNYREKCEGNSGKFNFVIYGLIVLGSFQISDKEVVLELNLPAFARPFKGMVEKTVSRLLEGLLSSASSPPNL